jgi:alpha-glucosidase
MQWSAHENAGFTDGQPWLPIANDYQKINVEAERDDPCSILTLYRSLIGLRRGEAALEVGRFEPVEAEGDVLAYTRRCNGDDGGFLIALNFGPHPQVLHRRRDTPDGTIALSTHLDRAGEHVEEGLQLRPHEGVLVRLIGRKRPLNIGRY